jgi:hypothetical protein
MSKKSENQNFPISHFLIPRLQDSFGHRGLRIGNSPDPIAVFPAIHPSVGDIQIFDDGDEITLIAGDFTHGHFNCWDNESFISEKAIRITNDVINFLDKLFADQIILWGSHKSGGGWRPIDSESFEEDNSSEEYVWSGPRQQ